MLFTSQDIGAILSGTVSEAELQGFKPEDVRALKAEGDRMVTRAVTKRRPSTVDEEARTVSHVASDGSQDRLGDRIDPRGWDLRAFRANPLLLWGHRDHEPPIGRVVGATKAKGGLDSGSLDTVSKFHSAEKYAFADLVFRMVIDGDLPAVSVGFMPIDIERPESPEEAEKMGVGRWGVLYRKQELLELSVVTVPANASALAKKLDAFEKRGVYPDHVTNLVRRYLDDDAPSRTVVRVGYEPMEVVDEYAVTARVVDADPSTVTVPVVDSGLEDEESRLVDVDELRAIVREEVRDGFERAVDSMLNNGIHDDRVKTASRDSDRNETEDNVEEDRSRSPSGEDIWDTILESAERELRAND